MPGVQVAAGGGEQWRGSSHAEALLFFLPTKTRRRRRKRSAEQVKQPALNFWSQCQAQLPRHFPKCVPWPMISGVDACNAPPRNDPFVTRYGGRLRGGATSEPSPEARNGGSPEDATRVLTREEKLIQVATSIEGMFEGCSYLPVFYLLKDEFGFHPVEISMTFGLTMVPWIMKPLLAMVSDRVPIFGQRRTPYLAAGSIIVVGSLAVASATTSYGRVVASLASMTFGRAVMGAVIQGMLVEVGRPLGHNETSALVGDFFLYRSSGAVLSSIVTTLVVSRFGPRSALRLALLLPACLLMSVAHYEAYRDRDAPVVNLLEMTNAQDVQTDHGSLASFRALLQQPVIWGPLIFLFVYNAGPNYDDPLYFYFINRLQFEPYMIGQLQIMHSLAKVLGVFCYRYGLRGVSDRTLIVSLTVLSCPLLLSPMLLTTGAYQTMHINPRLLALSGELVRELFIHLQMMPAMVRWVQLAPKRMEGTIVSLLSSTMRISGACSKLSSAALATGLGVTSTNFDNISLLIALCGGSALIPVAFAKDLIPDKPELMIVSSETDNECNSEGPAAQADRRPALDLSYELRGLPQIVPAG